MTASDLITDGETVVRALAVPGRGFSDVAARPRPGLALALSTALALTAAVVVIPRTDFGTGSDAEAPAASGQPPPEPTEYEREQAAAVARKVGSLQAWAGALLLPSLLAAGAAAGLSAGFGLVGARTRFRPALAVAAHGMLPVWLARVLAVPAAAIRAPVPAADVPRLLPDSLAALLPAGASPALAALLHACSLWNGWAVVLVALGMARVSGASRTRALATTATLFLLYAALAHVVPAGLAAAGATPR